MTPSADVVIIGGGCMGASVAYHLTRRGITDVVLIEREKMLGDRVDRPQRRRGAASVLERREHPAVHRVDSPARAVRRTKSATRSTFIRTAICSCSRRPSSVDTFRTERRVAAKPRRRRRLARRSGRRRTCTRVERGRGCCGDVLRARRRRRSERRHDGVRESGAGGRRDDRARHGSDRDRVTAGRVAAVETTRGPIETRIVVNAAGPHARRIGRMAGLDVPVHAVRRHIFIASAPRRLAAAARALVADYGDRLRHDVLFPPRRRRAALRHGRSE